jgi:hypothetical protein
LIRWGLARLFHAGAAKGGDHCSILSADETIASRHYSDAELGTQHMSTRYKKQERGKEAPNLHACGEDYGLALMKKYIVISTMLFGMLLYVAWK